MVLFESYSFNLENNMDTQTTNTPAVDEVVTPTTPVEETPTTETAPETTEATPATETEKVA